MRRLFILTAAAFSLASLTAASAEPEIVARVNGETVSRGELHRVQADLLTLRQLQGKLEEKPPEDEALKRLALRKLIHRHLILQEADRQKIKVTEQELDQAISALRSRFADLDAFGVWMKERELDDRSLFDSIRHDILAARVTAALLEGVEVSEQQVLDYYKSHHQEDLIMEQVRLRIIVVKSRVAAREILAALSEGENFSRLARQRSLGLRASQGGDTGWVNSRTLPPQLRRAVETLQAGEASRPLQKGDGQFLIVGVQGRRLARAQSLDEARPMIEQLLLVAMRQETVEAWLAEREKESKIEVLAPPEWFTTGDRHDPKMSRGNSATGAVLGELR